MIRSFSLLMVLLTGFVAAAAAQTPLPQVEEPALRPGDQVRITVWGMPEMSGVFVVLPDGSLEHPLYRQVDVAGVPLSTAEQRLANFLAQRDAQAQFVMAPLLRVAVGGEVGSPGFYNLPVNVTLAEAITLAGGVSADGDLSSVRLIRSGAVSRLDLRDPRSEAAAIPIRSGDQVVVGRDRSIMRDYVAPVSSVIGAISGVVILLIRAEVL